MPESRLNSHSNVPLHVQLEHLLRDQVQTGTLHSGDRIPSEVELVRTHGVSRNTVRRATETLVEEGLLFRDRGRGSFVVAQSLGIQCKIDSFTEHSETLRQAGYDPSVQHLTTIKQRGDKRLRSILELDEDEDVVCFTKLFFADDQPAILCRDYIPTRYLGDDFDASGSGLSYFRFLEEHTHRRVEFILAEIVPVQARGETAQLLRCSEGDPLLLLLEQFLDPTRRVPLSFAENLYRPDLVQFRVLRRRA